MRILVTGAAGFTGRRMMEFLWKQENVTPFGLIRRKMPAPSLPRNSLHSADLLDPACLNKTLKEITPDSVIHLAGRAHGTPEELNAANVIGTRNLLEASLRANPDCRILVISSSAVYGYAGDLPIPETTLPRPLGDYGRSKVAQETVSLSYPDRDAAIAIARPFNLAGPEQSDAFVCGRIVNQVIEIRKGKRQVLELREIDSSRDLLDVRDAVRGYWALLTHPDFSRACKANVFNLGSGNAYRIASVISLVEEITGERYALHLPKTQPAIAVPSQRSDNSRITSLTGWKPCIPLKTTLSDMLEADREKGYPAGY